MNGLSMGFPGRENPRRTPWTYAQLSVLRAYNFEPLSTVITAGAAAVGERRSHGRESEDGNE